jgi:dsRNA-specific ribonuclease
MKTHDIRALESALGHHFHDHHIIDQALTHSSQAREQEALQPTETRSRLGDNEQLEFLGDAVLGFVTSEALFQRFPEYHEGQLSKLRAHLVSERHLIQVAQQLDLGSFLRLGRGEEKSGGRHKTALLVDALEAVLAALYLDAGLEVARKFILDVIVSPELEKVAATAADGCTLPASPVHRNLSVALPELPRKLPSKGRLARPWNTYGQFKRRRRKNRSRKHRRSGYGCSSFSRAWTNL